MANILLNVLHQELNQGPRHLFFPTGKALQMPSLKTMTRKYFILTLKSHHAYHNMQIIFPIYKYNSLERFSNEKTCSTAFSWLSFRKKAFSVIK